MSRRNIVVHCVNVPPQLFLTARKRRITQRIRVRTHFDSRSFDNLRFLRKSRSGWCGSSCGQAALSLAILAAGESSGPAVVLALHPDRTNGWQVDSDGGEIELKCDDNDNFPDTVRGSLEVQEPLDGVETDEAHENGRSAEKKDGDDTPLFPTRHLQARKRRDGQDKDIDIKDDVLMKSITN